MTESHPGATATLPDRSSTEPTAPSAADRRPDEAPAAGGPGVPGTPDTSSSAPGPSPARRSLALPIAITLVAGTVLGGAAGAGTTALVLSQQQPDTSTVTGTPTSITVNDTGDVTAVTAVAAKAAPSIVTVHVSSGQTSAIGSGVVIDDQGHILTNTHVATLEGATNDATIEITDASGRIQQATIVGLDPIVDLAVLQVTDTSGMAPIEFADSSKVNVGDGAVVFGAALGLPNSVSDGVISSANRGITIQSSAVPDSSSTGDGSQDPGNVFDFWGFRNNAPDGSQPQTQTPSASGSGTISVPVFQTDAAINQGNSGGALLDTDGKLIGIVVALANGASSSSGSAGSAGVGFAIPSDVAQRVSSELIATGTATHGLLGATVSNATADDGYAGARIQEVVSGGAAEAAGLKAGDVLTSVDGVVVGDATDLTAWIRAHGAGEKVQIGFVRDGRPQTAEATLGALS
ncbi:MAG: trypsin-like peptidase domain-containing protein [Actinomycetales bacterium]|nr:trypsin-like peptidase domain-containing protein [Actinomycetales bacterium]